MARLFRPLARNPVAKLSRVADVANHALEVVNRPMDVDS